MTKKTLLVDNKYYSPDTPGRIYDNQDCLPKIKKVKKSFSVVTNNLEKRKYIKLSGNGNIHLLPKGLFIQNAIISKAEKIMRGEGSLHYRFSSMFSGSDRVTKKRLLAKFEDKIFSLCGSKNKKSLQYLKYASDPLLFRYFAGRELVLPYKIYSPDYFFRKLQTGESKPLIKPGEFFMTDFHFFQEMEDFPSFIRAASLNKQATELIVGKEWYLNIDTNIDFFHENKSRIVSLLDEMGVASTLNITSERTHYYSIQLQYIVDYFHGNQTQLSNLQFDQQSGKDFSISSATTRQPVSVVHGTLFGRTEKVIACVFGKQMELEKTGLKKPTLPLWLTPVVVRLILLEQTPEISRFVKEISTNLSKIQCRYDIDARNIPLTKKVSEAERDWVPFEVFVGRRECSSKKLSVRDRLDSGQYQISLSDFIAKIQRLLTNDAQPQTTPHEYVGDDLY